MGLSPPCSLVKASTCWLRLAQRLGTPILVGFS